MPLLLDRPGRKQEVLHDKAAHWYDCGNDPGGNGRCRHGQTQILRADWAVAAQPTIAISIEELQRQVDVHTLPAAEVEDLY